MYFVFWFVCFVFVFFVVVVFCFVCFFFQAEDGIRDVAVTGVQTCALPIYLMLIILETLRDNGIEIPFPQREVKILAPEQQA